MTTPSDTDLEAAAVQADALAKMLRAMKTAPVVPPPVVAGPQFTDLPHFKLARSQTFDRSCAEGDFLKVYPTMGAYQQGWKDTSKHGTYDPARLSVVDGKLRIHVGHRNGVPGGAVPHFKGLKGEDQLDLLYGRWEIKLHADPVSHYKIADLLWPASDDWDDGEIDFPEGSLNGKVSGFSHYTGDPKNQTEINAEAKLTDEHIYVKEWTPGQVKFILDGKVIGTATKNIPSKPMHNVVQVETDLDGSVPTSKDDGYVYVDHMAVWLYVA